MARGIGDLKAAVAGTGFVGAVHVDALRRLGVEVVGVCASTPEVAEAKGLAPAYESYDAMLADERVDVVHVATPNHLHHGQVRDALAAGKHVVCEKPLATTSVESAELLDLAQRSGLVHCTNFNLRFYPMNHQARALIASGALGTVLNVHGGYLQDWLLYPTDWNWRLEPEKGGALRAVADIGSHWMDLAQWVTGRRIERVFADLKTALPVRQRPTREAETFAAAGDVERVDVEMTTEDIAHLLFRLEGGCVGAAVMSQVSAGRKNSLRLEVDGSDGALAWDAERNEELWLGHRDRANETMLRNPGLLEAEAQATTTLPAGHAEGYADTFRELYRAVYSAVAEGGMPAEPDFPSFADGHRANALGDAIVESDRRATMGGGDDVNLGLMTAALPQLSLAEVAGWAASAGFEMLEVACWPAATSTTRRYAGVCHIDVEDLDPDVVRQTMATHGLEISSLAYYPNNLAGDDAAREEANAHLKKVIDAAAALEVGIVGTFLGAEQTLPLPENLQRFRTVWPPLVEYAEERGVKIAIENCPMIFSWDEWPSGLNIAHSPAVWDEMFDAIPSESFGLNLDPSHLVWLQIDYERVVYDYASRIIHVHAKDLEIRSDGLHRHGTVSLGMGWQVPRLPGLGEVRWDRFIAALYAVGYDFVVSIEHEDRSFEANEEVVKRGFLLSRNVLRPLLV